jgi:hypothetical protein
MAMAGNLLENKVDQWFLLSMVIRVYRIDGQMFSIFVRILEIFFATIDGQMFLEFIREKKEHHFDPKLNYCRKRTLGLSRQSTNAKVNVHTRKKKVKRQ